LIWFLTLHIIALIFWCASLLYLPALIAGIHSRSTAISEPKHKYGSVARFVFTTIATPAALLAITSGTVVFMLNRTVEVWLIVKLTLVTFLAVAHTLAGLLLMHTQDRSTKPIAGWCKILSVALWCLMTAIVWTVLAKPAAEVLP
jgi:putative membrane protein